MSRRVIIQKPVVVGASPSDVGGTPTFSGIIGQARDSALEIFVEFAVLVQEMKITNLESSYDVSDASVHGSKDNITLDGIVTSYSENADQSSVESATHKIILRLDFEVPKFQNQETIIEDILSQKYLVRSHRVDAASTVAIILAEAL